MNFRKRLVFFAGALVIVILAVVLITSSRIDVSQIPAEEAFHWLSDNEFYEPTFKLGMSKAEMSKIVPAPHNIDGTNVWVWIDDYGSRKRNGKEMTWRSLTDRGALFLVFTNDHVATFIFSEASGYTPWSLLQTYSKMSQSEVEAYLGPEPKAENSRR